MYCDNCKRGRLHNGSGELCDDTSCGGGNHFIPVDPNGVVPRLWKKPVSIPPIQFVILGQTLTETEALELYHKLDAIFGRYHG